VTYCLLSQCVGACYMYGCCVCLRLVERGTVTERLKLRVYRLMFCKNLNELWNTNTGFNSYIVKTRVCDVMHLFC
jgi:hypothetical protein